MAGRPRKTLAEKMRDGDTRKLGALRFQEEIASAWQARRGRPDYPEALQVQPENEEQAAKLKWAKQHWDYLMDTAEPEGLLALVDQAMVASVCMLFAQQLWEFLSGGRGLAGLAAELRQSANAAGFSEQGRAKIERPAPKKVDVVEEALMAGLPPGLQSYQ